MNPLRQLGKAVLAACLPRERMLVRGPRVQGKRSIALTFDDGPHPEVTPRLLDQLSIYRVRGTFFVIGRLAEQYPDLIRRIHDEGHEVANHTFTHSEPSRTSAATFLEEITNTDRLLMRLTGRIPSLVRPPKGELNWRKLAGLWRAKKTVVLWNTDPKDFRMQDADEMRRWCRLYAANDGDIVLMHDNHPYAQTAISELASHGHFDRFQTVTVSEWLGNHPGANVTSRERREQVNPL